MTNIVIPAIIAGLMLVAVGIAMSPIQDASAVHTTVQTNTLRHFALTAAVGIDDGAAVGEQGRWTFTGPFELLGATATVTADTGTDCNIGVSNIRTNLIPETGLAEDDPAAINALNDEVTLIDATVDNTRITGTTTLAIALEEGADCDADARATINAVVSTTSALTAAPTATIDAAVSGAKADSLAGD